MKRRTKAIRLIGFALFLILIVVAGFAVWLTYGFAYSITHPRRVPVTVGSAEVGIPNLRDVEFLTTDGLTLRGWYTPPTTQPRRAIILTHGHGANRVNMLPRAAWYAEQGYGVLLYDLRGHGQSDGALTTLGYLERADVIAAYHVLAGLPEIDEIVLHGESMGAAASIQAAVELPVRGLVIESTFSSLEDNITEGVRAWTGLPSFPFAPMILFFGQREAQASITLLRPIDVIAAVAPRPLLIMHGEQDPLLNVANAHRLYAAARDPKTLALFPTAQHVGLFESDPARWIEHVSAFLEQTFGV